MLSPIGGHITTDKTVAFGWDSPYNDRQHSRFWMGFYIYITRDKTVKFGQESTYKDRKESRIWMGFYITQQSRQQDLDGIKADKTEAFEWYSIYYDTLLS